MLILMPILMCTHAHTHTVYIYTHMHPHNPAAGLRCILLQKSGRIGAQRGERERSRGEEKDRKERHLLKIVFHLTDLMFPPQGSRRKKKTSCLLLNQYKCHCFKKKNRHFLSCMLKLIRCGSKYYLD